MKELPLDILTDAGFTAEEADSVVRHLLVGVDVHDGRSETDRLDIEALPPAKKEAVERFTMAVAADS